MMVAIFCMPQVMQASSDFFDLDGRTELINYVIEKEAEIKVKKLDLDKLFDAYFHKKEFVTSSVCINGQVCNFHDYVIVRKMYTTDADVASYRIVEEAFNLFVDEIIENIKVIIFNGADLQARDNRGKSIRDYCYTQKISDVLRDLGAPATSGEETLCIIVKGFLGVTTVTIGVMVLAVCYRVCYPL